MMECLRAGPDCVGDVQGRRAISGTSREFLYCQFHWDSRLKTSPLAAKIRYAIARVTPEIGRNMTEDQLANESLPELYDDLQTVLASSNAYLRLLDGELVSTAEISERLGVEKNTVHQWRYRRIFPEPDWRLSIGPVWEWSTVERWAEVTGRGGIHLRREI